MKGFAYVEVLVAVVLITVALVPATDALREAARHSELQRDLIAQRHQAFALMETVLLEPFSALEAEALATLGTTASQYSDPAGTDGRRLVWVAPHDLDNADGDANPLTGTDSGIVSVRVEVENSGIELNALAELQL